MADVNKRQNGASESEWGRGARAAEKRRSESHTQQSADFNEFSVSIRALRMRPTPAHTDGPGAARHRRAKFPPDAANVEAIIYFTSAERRTISARETAAKERSSMYK